MESQKKSSTEQGSKFAGRSLPTVPDTHTATSSYSQQLQGHQPVKQPLGNLSDLVPVEHPGKERRGGGHRGCVATGTHSCRRLPPRPLGGTGCQSPLPHPPHPFSSPERRPVAASATWAGATGCPGGEEKRALRFRSWAAQPSKRPPVGRSCPFVVPPGPANVTHTLAINAMWGRLAGPVSTPLQYGSG